MCRRLLRCSSDLAIVKCVDPSKSRCQVLFSRVEGHQTSQGTEAAQRKKVYGDIRRKHSVPCAASPSQITARQQACSLSFPKVGDNAHFCPPAATHMQHLHNMHNKAISQERERESERPKPKDTIIIHTDKQKRQSGNLFLTVVVLGKRN